MLHHHWTELPLSAYVRRRSFAPIPTPRSVLRALDEPILVDEWPLVPDVLGAVKRAVDDDPRPGRFILTGSSQTDLTTAGWPATGRIVRLTMHPLVGRERHGDPSAPSLIDRIFADGPDSFSDPSGEWDVHRYVTEALTSGWPPNASA